MFQHASLSIPSCTWAIPSWSGTIMWDNVRVRLVGISKLASKRSFLRMNDPYMQSNFMKGKRQVSHTLVHFAPHLVKLVLSNNFKVDWWIRGKQKRLDSYLHKTSFVNPFYELYTKSKKVCGKLMPERAYEILDTMRAENQTNNSMSQWLLLPVDSIITCQVKIINIDANE